MNEPTVQIPEKRRLDIIDTALLRQREKQALKWLVILFTFSIFYEFRDFFQSPLLKPNFPVAELNLAKRRPFPEKRIHRLSQALRDLQQAFPLIRDALKPQIEILEWLKKRDPKMAGKEQLNSRLENVLNSIWRLSHSQLWEDRKPFMTVDAEMLTLFTLLRKSPPDEQELPILTIGPRPIGDREPAGRDLFQFHEAEKPSKPLSGGDEK